MGRSARGRAAGEGRPALPPHRAPRRRSRPRDADPSGSTATATCGYGRGPPRSPETPSGHRRRPGGRGRGPGLRGDRPRELPAGGRAGRAPPRGAGHGRPPPPRGLPPGRAVGRRSRRSPVTHAEVVAGIGEGGFDLFYEHSARDEQEVAFRAQVRARARARPRAGDPLARRVGRHVRGARRRRRPRAHRLPLLHRWSRRSAPRALDLGAHLSFSGIVSFKNADDVRAAAALVPLDRVLVETDAPVPRAGAAPREAEPPGVGGRRRRRARRRDGPLRRGGRGGDPPERGRGLRSDPQPRPPLTCDDPARPAPIVTGSGAFDYREPSSPNAGGNASRATPRPITADAEG